MLITQVKLRRGDNFQITWVKSQGVKVGATVKQPDGTFWKIAEVWGSEQEQYVHDQHDSDGLKEVTDI